MKAVGSINEYYIKELRKGVPSLRYEVYYQPYKLIKI